MFVGSSDTAILGSMTSHKPLSLQLSSSWIVFPSGPGIDDPYFKRMAAQGQSFFKGAGDSGDYGDGSCSVGVWPRDDAYITTVGGTSLTTKGPGKGWASETGWVDGGGGYCPVDGIPIPSWQKLKGVITKANQGSTKYRNGPDVSANANFTFYVCADQTTCTANEYGGVSFATPMWAGYIALANQQAAAKKLPPPGFINPTIYPLGLGKDYATDFHDITSGGNGNPPTKGYNLTGGWGSPNKGLIDALVK
jgi:kumamolisin